MSFPRIPSELAKRFFRIRGAPLPQCGELVVSEAKVTAVAFARCRKGFEDPVLDALWGTQHRLTPPLKCFPQEVWEEWSGNIVGHIMAAVFSELNRLI